jgi:hypothetical protein
VISGPKQSILPPPVQTCVQDHSTKLLGSTFFSVVFEHESTVSTVLFLYTTKEKALDSESTLFWNLTRELIVFT